MIFVPVEDYVLAEIFKSQAIDMKIAQKNIQLAALKTFEFVKPDYRKYFPRKNPFKQRSAVDALIVSVQYSSVCVCVCVCQCACVRACVCVCLFVFEENGEVM